MVRRSKITTLGLGPFVDNLIIEGHNKSEIERKVNEELANRGKKAITYECVSNYVNSWRNQLEESASRIVQITTNPVPTAPDWGYDVVRSMIKNGEFADDLAKSMVAAIEVENGLINTMKFYSAVVLAGLAKVLKNPELVSVNDAMKAAALLAQVQSGGSKTILQQAIQINQSKDLMQDLLREAAIIEAEFDV